MTDGRRITRSIRDIAMGISEAQEFARNQKLMTLDQFTEFFGDMANPESEYSGLMKTCQEFEIDTAMRLSHFLGQVAQESGGLKFRVESLNYRWDKLGDIFSFYRRHPELAKAHGRSTDGSKKADQEAIANHVYADENRSAGYKLGNGGPDTGDGWRFRGAGYVQLTGRTNYQGFTDGTGIDIMEGHEAIMDSPSLRWMTAGFFWDNNNINDKADANDYLGVTKRVNGAAAHAADEREAHTKRAQHILGI